MKNLLLTAGLVFALASSAGAAAKRYVLMRPGDNASFPAISQVCSYTRGATIGEGRSAVFCITNTRRAYYGVVLNDRTVEVVRFSANRGPAKIVFQRAQP